MESEDMTDISHHIEILVVEDSRTQAEKLKFILEKRGFKVSVTNDGKEALEYLKKRRPDIVISDIMMPEMDGYELCKKIRTDLNLTELPLILVTTLSDPLDVIRGLEVGASSFITKPYDEQFLVSRIRHLIANRKLRGEAKDEKGIDVFFSGQNFHITAEPRQILDLLLSTYENAYQQNCHLVETEHKLNWLNERLEDLLKELTVKMAEQKETEAALRESEKHFRSLFEGMTEGFALHEIICDDDDNPVDYRFLEVNPAFERLTGLNSREVIGKTMLEALPGEDIRWVETYGSVALTGKPIHFEHYSATLKRHYEVFAYCPAPRQFATLFTDITERRRHEEQISRLNKDLVTRNEELEFAYKEMESFIYSISHDLRGPLRAISGFSSLLLEDSADRSVDQTDDYLRRICLGAAKMNQLIDDLLRLSRVSRQEMTRTEVNLSKVAESIIAELRESNPDRQVDIRIEEGISAFADLGLIKIVHSNLLGNAWKFTSKTEKPLIEFGKIERDGNTVYYIRDNGAGFNAAYAGKMFMPFQRLHARDEFEGTGIGLAIVDRIIRRHGGKIWAEGETDKGATIFFSLT